MKKFKFKCLICAVAMLVFAVPMLSVPAFANSGPPWEEGVTPSGVHLIHENSVLEVQSETLTFNIGTPPYELKEGDKYDTTVTAEYTFRNPTADTVNTKMAFPIGLMPYYEVDKEKLTKIENPITVNGQPVEYTVRHTYGTYNDFSADVKKIKDDYIQTDFFNFGLPVTEYVFSTNLEDNKGGALFKAKLPQSPNTRYLANADRTGQISSFMQKNEEFSVYVLGDDIDITALDWTITRYNEFLERHTAVKGSVSLVKKAPTVTFKDYALRGYDKSSGISEIDWYNAAFECIRTDGVCAGFDVRISATGFTEWYVYETSVEPNGLFTNAVTANLFPRIYFEYEPNVYEYSYYLSPAKEWAAFGNLTVNINTKLFMQSGEYYDVDTTQSSKFTKTDTGYTATFATLPERELHFSMCSVQTPERRHVGTAIPPAVIIVFCVLVFGIPLIAGITVAIIFIVKRKRKKSAQTEQPYVPPVQEMEADRGIDDGLVEWQNDNKEENDQMENNTFNYCIYCGSKLDADVKFCPNCGGATTPPDPVPPVQPAPQVKNEGKLNGFGIAGFAVSVVAWIFIELLTGFAFVLTAVGFGLSLTGVLLRKKYPKVYGLAIAGLAVSSVMVLLFLIGVLIGILAVIGLIII